MANMNIKTEKILSASNIRRIIMLGINLRDQLSNMELGLISDYDNTKTYTRGQAVYYNNYLYKCLYTTTGTWDSTKWQKIGDELDLITKADIEAMLGLTQEEIASLQSLISTEIRLDKVFSSSDTYNRLLTVENECKKFTLEQLAKKAGVVYKVVADTTGVDSTEFLYLISNGSNGYNIYAYIDGSAVKISDTNINLDGYAKLTDLDDFLKKTDADSKFATITTVDGKVDKTSILTTISSTPSDDKLLSEKAIGDTFVKKTDITTTIDSTSTDSELPTAKSVWGSLYELRDPQVLVDANKPTSRICEADFTTINTPAKEGATSAESSLIISIEGRDYWNGQISISMAEPEVFVRSVRESDTWTKWRKLFTTSVKDVPTTNIDLTGNSNVSQGDITYMVRNGICYVSILNAKFGGTPVTSAIPEGTFPKPVMPQWQALNGVEDCTKNILVSVNTRGGLSYHTNSDINMHYDGSLSYPVENS